MNNKIPTVAQIMTTEKAEQLKEVTTDVQLSVDIGIARNTLYSRLKTSAWKTSEIVLIKILHQEKFKNQ